MKIRALVAITDGRPDVKGEAFDRGSIKSGAVVPVTRDFDRRLPPIGTATIVVEGDRVYAEMDIPDDVTGVPALGGRVEGMSKESDTFRINGFDVREVSVCAANSDQRIPAIPTDEH